MSDNTRIAKNTLLLYFRQILIMLVALYTVRVVLNTLGATDYGVYNVVGGIVTMFGFLSSAMATASQRYFSYDLGKKDYAHLKTVFSVTFLIYLFLITIIVILAETVGLWFVCTKLVIPAERKAAAIVVYETSIVVFITSLVTTPYMASIIAHENMDVYAYAGILEALLKLAIAFLLKIIPLDKLIVYGILVAIVSVINASVYILYCLKHYEECKFHFIWDKDLFKEMASYSGWNLFGSSIGVVKNQIINIILNMFYGPVVNAARAIAAQINSAVSSFSVNFSTAIRPQIIKTYASDDKESMFKLMVNGSRLTFLLMFVLATPIFFQIDPILQLWLKEVPENTATFTRLVLIDVLIDSISYTLGTGIQATGKIKYYQIIISCIQFLNLPISYLLIKLNFSIYFVFYTAIALTTIAFIARSILLDHLLGLKLFSKLSLLNLGRVLLTITGIVSCMFFIEKLMKNQFCITIMLVEYVIEALIALGLGLTRTEQKGIFNKIKDKVSHNKNK